MSKSAAPSHDPAGFSGWCLTGRHEIIDPKTGRSSGCIYAPCTCECHCKTK